MYIQSSQCFQWICSWDIASTCFCIFTPNWYFFAWSHTFSFNHGLCSRIPIYWYPKVEKVTTHQHGLGVDKWCSKWRGTYNQVECAYISHVQILKCLDGECTHENSPMVLNIYKWIPSQAGIDMPIIQNHLGHIWYGVLLFNLVI